MFIKKNYGIKRLLQFSWMHLTWLITLWDSLVLLLHHVFHETYWVSIPWLPIAVIGTAVAFYVGFKNNSAYDRLWEARKIWGGIVNTSRMWGSISKSYVGNTFRETSETDDAIYKKQKTLIHRHIAWLYTLRELLLNQLLGSILVVRTSMYAGMRSFEGRWVLTSLIQKRLRR